VAVRPEPFGFAQESLVEGLYQRFTDGPEPASIGCRQVTEMNLYRSISP